MFFFDKLLLFIWKKTAKEIIHTTYYFNIYWIASTNKLFIF